MPIRTTCLDNSISRREALKKMGRMVFLFGGADVVRQIMFRPGLTRWQATGPTAIGAAEQRTSPSRAAIPKVFAG